MVWIKICNTPFSSLSLSIDKCPLNEVLPSVLNENFRFAFFLQMTHTAIQSRKMSSSIVVRKRVHVLVALVLILLLDSCTSNPLTSTSHHLFKRDKQKYCGDKLTATLNMVCGGSYNSKRSGTWESCFWHELKLI